MHRFIHVKTKECKKNSGSSRCSIELKYIGKVLPQVCDNEKFGFKLKPQLNKRFWVMVS